MLTQKLLGAAEKLVPPVSNSDDTRHLIEQYRQSGRRGPRRDTQIDELRLVVAHAFLFVAELVAFVAISAIAPGEGWHRAIFGTGLFFMVVLLSGLVLHLFRYYRALIVYYREKNQQKRGRMDFTDAFGSRRLSSDRDLIFQLAVGLIVVLLWLSSGK